ncbi:transcription activator [Fimbriimonas ginsengisoli Gsoil 348]|uniref:Transcription activator n=1 Tax=Fimbriimonas ginsengisoli Gsoil 348 TaxID=661478 RepID=A0A068NY83_FIMGI|nr:transcription activator [Fimbriimonas ginsengisoli Gsoil 348]
MSIRSTETLQGMATVFPRLMPKLMAWAAANHVKPSGPEFIRFNVIDMAKGMEIELGFPVTATVRGSGEVHAGAFPAGRYVFMPFTGNYRDLVGANATLQQWAAKKGIKWKVKSSPKGDVWAGRMEFYLTDPGKEPDPRKWKSEIYYLTLNK